VRREKQSQMVETIVSFAEHDFSKFFVPKINFFPFYVLNAEDMIKYRIS